MAYLQLGKAKNKAFSYNTTDATRHIAVIGSTGSGKTVLCKAMLEELLTSNIPVIAIDPKGDIGSLAVLHEHYDFRPFLTKQQATKVASDYTTKANEWNLDPKKIKVLQNIDISIFTPKSATGKQVSMLPSLDAPKGFANITDYTIIAEMVEPVSQSILILAGIKNNEKLQSLISELLIAAWKQGESLDYPTLIEQIQNPPITDIGSLPIEDFIGEKERKKATAQINTILTSPAKRAWSQGDKLEIGQLLKPKSLNVFDLRYSGSEQEKQLVVEHILQELYKFLLHKGGDEKLKYVLYIDELAGLMPPAPANPPVKRTLSLLIRQARAFGLSIILATQNPGDIDYKVLSNIGTRFIGKLRTQNDVEKVASAADIKQTTLKKELAHVKTGQFYYHNAIKNTEALLNVRWLYSYHGGPLTAEQIKWVNDHKLRPKIAGEIKKVIKKATTKKTREKHISTQTLIDEASSSKPLSPKQQKRSKPLEPIITQAKKYADHTQLKIATTDAKEYVPHLRLVIECRDVDGMQKPMQGPYLFDLTSKLIPMENYLKGVQFRQTAKDTVSIVKPKRSIVDAFEYAIKDAKTNLAGKYWKSDILEFADADRDVVEKKNLEQLKKDNDPQRRYVERQYSVKIEGVKDKISMLKSKKGDISRKVTSQFLGRIVKRLLGNKRVQKRTEAMRQADYKKRDLDRKIKREKALIDKLKKEQQLQLEKFDNQLLKKAHTGVTQRSFKPVKDDLKIHATILLVPKRATAL